MQACGGSVGDAQVKNDKLFFLLKSFCRGEDLRLDRPAL
jgi:hypothetical protein